ncbi:MAG: hypothetical protein AAB250_06450 [Bdellovibrionota bacterium]
MIRILSALLVFFISTTVFAQTEPAPVPAPSPTPVATPEPTPAPIVEAPAQLSEPVPGLAIPSVKPSFALDVLAALPTENAVPAQERFRFRTLDIGARIDFDERSHAVIDVGGRDSNGTMTFRLREGYVQAAVDSWSVLAGSFFLGFGLLNRIPSTDWPFTSAPLSQSEFFSEERAYDSGAELTWRANDRVAVALGVTNGYWYGTAPITGGDKPLTPTHYARPSLVVPVGDGRIEFAFDYLSRVDVTGERMRLGGFEAAFTRGPVTDPTWTTWLEVNHRYNLPSGLPLEEKLGGYLFNQAKIDRSWSAGVRLDALTITSLTNTSGQNRANLQAAVVPVATYRLTPATELKTSYTYLRETRDGDSTRGEQRIEFVFTARSSGRPSP